MSDDPSGHAGRLARLAAALRANEASPGAPLALGKRTSNLFRDRDSHGKHKLDLGDFRHVLSVDPAAGRFEAEGLTTYESLVDAMLPYGCMPAVVPQLKTITLGGAAAGVGIEATSFSQGLVHDTLSQIEVLLPGGDIVTATPRNEYRDLFLGFANSYGTLGYALRLEARALPTRPYVEVSHVRCGSPIECFAALGEACGAAYDFVDGVVFDERTFVLNLACFVDEAPWTSDYTFERIYYKSLLERPRDFLTARDYVWRWDTDWFWCSKNLLAQNPLVRRLFGRKRLNSRTYTGIMRWNSRIGLTRRLSRLRGLHPESVIQDVDIPLPRAAEFLDFLIREIGILPVWLCPIRPAGAEDRHPLYPLEPDVRYVNFGFWDVVQSPQPRPDGWFNRLVEREVAALGGIKSLYSDSYFTPEEFARAYDLTAYEALKRKYDPSGRALSLYDKTVLRR